MLGHKALRCTNTAASSQERWIMANSVSGHNLLEQNLLNTYATCVIFYGPQNNPYICLGLWEKKAQTYIHGLDENQLEKSNFINLDRYPIYWTAVEPWADTTP